MLARAHAHAASFYRLPSVMIFQLLIKPVSRVCAESTRKVLNASVGLNPDSPCPLPGELTHNGPETTGATEEECPPPSHMVAVTRSVPKSRNPITWEPILGSLLEFKVFQLLFLCVF